MPAKNAKAATAHVFFPVLFACAFQTRVAEYHVVAATRVTGEHSAAAAIYALWAGNQCPVNYAAHGPPRSLPSCADRLQAGGRGMPTLSDAGRNTGLFRGILSVCGRSANSAPSGVIASAPQFERHVKQRPRSMCVTAKRWQV